jgi:hypothetical protein
MGTNSAIATMASIRKGPAAGLNPLRRLRTNRFSKNKRYLVPARAIISYLVGLLFCPLILSAQTASPTSISFGNVAVNDTSLSKTVTVTNNQTTAVTVGTPSITANFAIAGGTCTSVSTLASGKTCTYLVTFTPSALQAYSGALTINLSGGATSSINITLSGTGAAPQTASPTSISFGNVAVNDTSLSKTVTVTNNQASTASVGTPSISANFAIATGGTCTSGYALASGKSCTYFVTFSPTALQAYTGTLSINVTGEATSPISVTLSGTGTAPQTASPTSVSFGNVAVSNTSLSKTVTVTNNQTAAVTVGTPTTTANFAIATGGTCTPGYALANAKTCTYLVTFSPSALQAYTGTLSINVTGEATSPISVTLSGTGTNPVTASPTSLSFGNVAVNNTSFYKTVTLTNNQTTTVTVGTPTIPANLAVASGGTCTSGLTLAYGMTCTYFVTFTPTATQAYSGTLTLNSSGGAAAPIGIPVSGTGTPPAVLSGTTSGALSFGNVVLGTTSAPKTLTLSNYQSTALVITPPVLSGEFTATLGTCSTNLAPESSCTFVVTFAPAALGTRTSVLNIVTSTSNSPFTVNLTGVGVAPAYASPSTLSYSAQQVGTVSTAQTVTLTNYQLVGLNLAAPSTTGDFTIVAGGTCGSYVAAGKTCTYRVAFAPQAAGVRSGMLTINDDASNTPQTVTLSGTGSNAAASILNVLPGVGTAGTTLTAVQVAGRYTHFTQGTPTVSFGAGITVSNTVVLSDTLLTVNLAISSTATPGSRTVSVSTPLTSGTTETASLSAGFVVSTSAGLTISISPNTAAQGQTVTVAITGTGTHFKQGTTVANFGAGITATLTVTSTTQASASVTVSSTTYTGWRPVTVVTGGEYAVTGAQGFDVTSGPALLLSVMPNTGSQGTNITGVLITGFNTHFQSGATQFSFTGGINVGTVNVTSVTSATVDLAVTPSATVGAQAVTVTTGSEVATLANAFTVVAATPYISSVTPSSASQGTNNLTVNITGVNTNFQSSPTPTATLGSNITVNSMTVNSTTSVTLNISIAWVASTGSRTGTLTFGSTNYNFPFTVTPSAAAITSLSPSSGPQNTTQAITVTGSNTHWVQGTTTASFVIEQLCPVITVNKVTVNSATSALLNATIPYEACTGGEQLIMATGGEAPSASFTVLANTPTVMMNPSNAVPNSTLSVNFTGDFTHFVSKQTTAVVSGQGVTLQNFTVTSAESATATAVVAAIAPTGGYLVTLTTPLSSGGSEIVSTWFNVAPLPVYLESINPYHVPPSTSNQSIEIIGVNTHFTQGQTTLTFGPDVTVSNLTVASSTDLTATIRVDATAAIGWRNLYVNTGSEQVTGGFRIDGLDPIIVGVTPSSGQQGQTISQVTITGQNTHFQQGVTQAIVGAGITVSNLAVSSATAAIATIAISPTAPAGPNTVVMITGSEVASGAGFNVTPGAAQILYVNSSTTPCVAPSSVLSVTQGQTLNVCVVGQLSNWQQGVTTASFGPGIAVDALSVTSPTTATAQITVLSTAPLGYEPVTLLTNGEYAMINQGINVVQGTAALLSSSPNSAQQGSTLNVQVLGSLTHWQTGVTTASYSIPGILVNSFTAQDSNTGVMNVSVSPLTPVLVLPGCAGLTITTGTEQVGLANQFCVQAGPATLTNISPSSAIQGSTPTVTVTGQSTHFIAGVTTASFGAGVNVSSVNVLSPTTATVSLAVTSSAPTGYHTATLTTDGENASLANFFQVTPGTPTLNQCSPVSGQQGQTLSVHCIGQYTSWVQGTTTATFGPGVTVNSVTVDDATDADVAISIDPLAYVGSTTVTFTTSTEIVSSPSVFSIAAGPAIISQVTPGSANQGQEVVLNITGEYTHWAQGLTQFSLDGAGIDIKINNVVINSATSANADITISPTASLGSRSIYMVTGGEALADRSCEPYQPCVGALIITGGIPSVIGLSPNGGNPGNTNLNVQITGAYTNWTSASTTVDFGPGIAVQNYTVNNSTSITAVVNIDASAALGYRTITVQTGTQAVLGAFNVFTPPPPYIWPYYPAAGIPGQTITMSFTGNSTNWVPNTTQIVFSPETSAITVNSFQVLSPTSATANITIASGATAGLQTITFTTLTETETVPFDIAIATPTISIVDPVSGMQGATLNVNVIGQYTTFDQNNTVFTFGPGITVNSQTVLGPTVAQVNISVGQEAALAANPVVATTGTQVASGSCSPWPVGCFTVTASQAVVLSISPNTAFQGNTLTGVNVVGLNTHWDSTTTFSFGSGITVTGQTVNSNTSATLSLSVAALANTGNYTLTATTGGEVATLLNAFVVQPGTPLVLSSAPASGQQQGAVIFTILGQFTQWDPTTQVSFGTGVTISQVNVTSPNSITVNAAVQPTTYVGFRTLTVTTGSQVLPLPNAFYVLPGPAAVSGLSPAQAAQGQTLNVVVTGTNTNFMQNVTAASFGFGVTVNSVNVTSPTSATVNITVSASATPGLNTVTMTTLGETATDTNAFTITQATPELTYINPSGGYQSQSLTNVAVTGLSTHFNGTTVFNFGSAIIVTPVSIKSATSATVDLAISPTASVGPVTVTATTGTEIATGVNLFTVNAGAAAITSVNPASGMQGQTGLVITVTGSSTNFTAALPTVSFGPGVTVTNIQVASDTSLTATVNISPTAPAETNTVTVTTGGQLATLANGFTVLTATAAVTSISPNSGYQTGPPLDVIVNGTFTHFAYGTTTASFGPGITVNSVSVYNSTQADVNITVQAGAPLRAHTVTMTTGGEVAVGTNLFTVLQPQLSFLPTSALQGSTVTLAITGVNTHFVSGTTAANFGNLISVTSFTVSGPTSASAQVNVSNTEPVGVQTVTLTTGTEVDNGFLIIVAGTPAITLISPNAINPTQTETVTVTGAFTNWNSTTTANFGPGISVGGAAAGTFGPVTVSPVDPSTQTQTLVATLTTNGASLGSTTVQVQTGAQTLTVNNGFTVETCTATAPTVLLFSPLQGATDVPVNSTLSWQFSTPMNRGTITLYDPVANPSGSIVVYDTVTGSYVAGAISIDASSRVVTLTPAQALAIGRQYWLSLSYTNYIQDTCGNNLPTVLWYLTTSFTPDTTGPNLIGSSPEANDTNSALNAPLMLQFDKVLDPITAENGITVQTGGVPVTGTFGFSTNGKTVTFTPTSIWPANTSLTVAYTTQISDTAGNALANPGSFNFSTGAATDTTAPTVTLVNPPNGSTGVGLNVTPRVVFSEPINQLSLTSSTFYLQNYDTAEVIYGTVNVAADQMSATLTPNVPLLPGTAYYLYANFTDIAGNGGYSYTSFATGIQAVTTPASVVTFSPASGETGVPLNTNVVAVMSAQIDPTTVTNSAITLAPPAAGAVTLASDGVTLTFVPSGPLNPSTYYTVTVSGFKDIDGNPVASSTDNFTTGALSSTAALAVNSVTPANGVTGVPVNSSVVFAFSAPVNPATVSASTMSVSAIGAALAGTYSVNGSTVTFTPQGVLPGNTQIYVSVNGYVQDLAGNSCTGWGSSFTTANTPDTTPPTVTSVTPTNNATNVGQNTQVVITFSKSINPSTLTSTSLVLFNSDTPISGYGCYYYYYYGCSSISPDNRTVTINANGYPLPAGATITLAATHAIQDLSGNPLADFSSQFTVAPQVPATGPSITSQRPGSGATNVAANTVITLFASAPLNPSTVSGAIHVSDNGVAITGSVQLLSSNQAIEFTPANPFSPGDLIQVFLDQSLQDVYGNPLSGIYSGQFTVANTLSSTPPQLLATNPIYGAGNVPTNTLIQLAYNQPLLASTVNTTNITIHDDSVGSVTPQSVQLDSTGQIILITPPGGSLTSGDYYQVGVNGVTNTQGVAVPSTYLYFTAGSSSDTVAPTVTSIAPPNGWPNIGTNAGLRVVFSKAVNPITVTGSTIQLSGGGTTATPWSISFSPDYTTVNIVPQAPLPASATITVAINGVQSVSGIPVTPLTTTFQTLSGPDFSAPYVVTSSVTNGQANVPVNSVFSLRFNKPMAVSTYNPGSCYVAGGLAGAVQTTVSFSQDLTTLYMIPASNLAVGLGYYLVCSGMQDLSGNTQSYFQANFTTSFVSSVTAPQVIDTNPENGLGSVPTNTPIQILFNEPIQPTSLGQVTLTTESTPVSVAPSFLNGNQLLVLTPSVPLLPGTPYTLSISGVLDNAGNQMSGTVTVNFTTAAGIDLTTPTVTLVDPASGSTGVGLNAQPHVTFSERINPLSLTSSTFYLENYDNGKLVPATVSIAADRMSASLSPTALLQAGTTYYLYLSSFTDVAGNVGSFSSYFTTGTQSDTTPASVVTFSPATGSTGVPLNTNVVAVMSAQIDPTTISNSAITLSPPVAGAVTLASDGVTLTFVPSGSFNPATNYAATVSGFKDVEGNTVATATDNFTTGNLSSTAALAVNSVTPANGVVGVPVNSSVVFTFSAPVDPATVSLGSMVVSVYNTGAEVAGTYSVSGSTVTFTSQTPLPGNTQMYVAVNSYVQDLAGNSCSGWASSFTTANTPDTTPPTVTSVTPPNNATNVGQNTKVVITFSKSINPSTITGSSLLLLNGDTPLGPNYGCYYTYNCYSISADNRTVTINSGSNAFPAGATITVAATHLIQDLSGNPLADFSSQFTVVPQVPTSGPSIVGQRPGSGATNVPANTVITLFSSAPLDPNTVDGAVHVSQNGVIVSGTTQLLDNGQAIEFTPNSAFSPGGIVQVFVDSSAQDTYGNPLTAYNYGQFTVAGATAALVATNPFPYAGNVPLNTVIQLAYNQPLAAGTVNTSNITVYDYSVGYEAPQSVQLDPSGQVILITPPGGSLVAGDEYSVVLSGVTNSLGVGVPSGWVLTFTAGSSSDTVAPTVTSVTPPNGSNKIGTNAAIKVIFSKAINPITVTGSTIQVTGNGTTVVPSSISFSTDYTTATIVPMTPLPASAATTITISGVQSVAGVPVTPATTTVNFNTMAGPDFSAPYVVNANVYWNQTGVPINAAFTMQFNKPLDQSTLNPSVALYTSGGQLVATNASFSADGTTVILTPTSNLALDQPYVLESYNLQDLSGNTQQGFNLTFTTGSTTDTTPPTVLAISPPSGFVGAPTNTLLQILFSTTISATSLGQVSLQQGSTCPATPVPTATSLILGDTAIQLTPSAPLLPSTTYTVCVTGVTDVTGNTMAGPFSSSFTTGTGINLTPPTIVSVTPTNGAIDQPAGTTVVTVVFSEAMDPVSFNSTTTFVLEDPTGAVVPATITFSPDLKTATLTPTAPLSSGDQLYSIYVNYLAGGLTDLAGNGLTAGSYNTFYTQ